MRNYQMKKIIGFLLLVSIVFNSVIVITPTNIKAQEVDNVSEEMEETVESIEDKEICEDALSMIGKMVNAENCQNWDEYAQYWRAENCQFLKNALHNETYIKNRTGVSNVKSAKVVMCEKVTDSNQVDIVEYVDYQDVQVYLVGIDYEVYETQESFYDGVNYRYYIIGKENGTYKVLDVTEAQLDYLKDVVANEENGVVVYEAEQHTNKDLEVQIENRENRIAEGECSYWLWTSLVVQWLKLHPSNAGDTGLISGWGTEILHTLWHNQKKLKIHILKNIVSDINYILSRNLDA